MPRTPLVPARWRVTLILLVILGLPAGVALWGFMLEPARLVVHRTDITLPHWPARLKGLRIALIADLHGGSPYITFDKIRRVVRETNAAHPDLVLLAGDFVTGERAQVGGRFMPPEVIAPALRGLHARLGVFATLGNHDRWFNGPRVQDALEQAGIRVLENDAVRVEGNGAALWIAGIGDLWTGHPDVAAALAKVSDDAPVIALTHNPDIFPEIPARVALTLAGHTHGGQVVLPFIGRPFIHSPFGERYTHGHVVEGSRHLFVTTGIGTSIVPARFGVPPEIAVLTLD
jgi:uncharacterized protein